MKNKTLWIIIGVLVLAYLAATRNAAKAGGGVQSVTPGSGYT